MKRNYKFLVLLCIIALSWQGCERCDYPMYAGISAAAAGDDLEIIFDGQQVCRKVFEHDFLWSDVDMPKVVTGHCTNDSLITVQIKIINAHRDTTFQINNHKVRGFYIATSTAGVKDGFIVDFDYYEGGLRGVIWTDSTY